MQDAVPLKKLILVPAVITLVITLVRLLGELQRWSPTLFNREAGGGGALVGIAWLVPVFGVYFALKLIGSGERPAGAGPAIGYPLAGAVLLPVAGVVAAAMGAAPNGMPIFAVFVVGSVVGAILAFRGWPALGRTLFAYGLSARIPVVVIMLFAILGRWGTHYDAVPPGLPEMSPVAKWALIGLLPQLTIWIWFTMAVGALLGGIAAAVKGRGRSPAAG